MTTRVMPAQRPGRSEQSVGTPDAFLCAVAARFGGLSWDLAADKTNHVTAGWFGPGSPYQEDSFSANWRMLAGLCWLNPPYGEIGKWAEKCAAETGPDLPSPARVALLVPASVGTNWFAAYVDKKALVLFLSPRLTFVGHTQSYPKDLMLCMYGDTPGYECWRWRP